LDTQEKGHMGMQRIRGKDPSSHRQGWQKHQCHRDLIGFLLNLNLKQGFLTVMGPEGEQMRSLMIIGACPSHGFAIQGNRVIWGSYKRHTDPISQGPFDLRDIEARQQFAVERIVWAVILAGTKYLL
jgi:hypothetical protein